MKILFVQTGGTIDKYYPAGETHHGYEFEIGKPAVESILKRGRPEFEFEVTSVLQKDSLDLNDEDRQLIYDFVAARSEEKIILTHGTDTIMQTAKKLKGIDGKTVVITGSMLPEKFYESDADFNLGMAIGVVQTQPSGVYVVLNGLVTNT